jgi:hypothetical protein
MKTAYLKIIILAGFTQFFIMSPSLAQKISQDEQNLLPRTFCQKTNGIISETGNHHVFICCYAQKKKCVINNEKEGHGRIIQFSYIDNNEQSKDSSLFN